MRLHTVEWGHGDRLALLLHGMTGDTQDWWQVAPVLAERGYRVVGVDLAGHGQSPAAPDLTVEESIEALVGSVPAQPELAIGHSMGGIVLAATVDRLRPQRAVYVDAPFRAPAFANRLVLSVTFREMKRHRTLENLRRDRPAWGERDRQVAAASARLWDVDTSVNLCLGASKLDLTPTTEIPSLVVLADPSEYVPPEEAERLRDLGFEVRVVADAGHSVWFGHFEEFLAALEGWI